LPKGGFIGSILLVEVWRMGDFPAPNGPADRICGNWEPGRYAWLGRHPEAFPLIPARGQQGFWRLPALSREPAEQPGGEPC
jgi:hypothetical protein